MMRMGGEGRPGPGAVSVLAFRRRRRVVMRYPAFRRGARKRGPSNHRTEVQVCRTANAPGLASTILSSARAGPAGRTRCCSQFCSVLGLTPIR
jgi:hypothetical protein